MRTSPVMRGSCLLAGVAAMVGGILSPAATGATAPAARVAVQGNNEAAYTTTVGQGYFAHLGGRIQSAPAVASQGGVDYYVATGTNNLLYARTGTLGWRQAASSAARCYDPALTVQNQPTPTLVVACQGAWPGLQLFVSRWPIAAGALPYFRQWTKLGGRLEGGVGVTQVSYTGGSYLLYLVLGGQYGTPGDPSGDVWARTDSTGWYRWAAADRHVICKSNPEVAATGGWLYFGCTDPGVWTTGAVPCPSPTAKYECPYVELYSVAGATGKLTLYRYGSTSGIVRAGPAFSVSPNGSSAVAWVIGSNSRIYYATVTPGASNLVSGWTNRGGVAYDLRAAEEGG